MKRSVFAWVGIAAAVVIVVVSFIVRTSNGPADPAADVAGQRAAVTRFNDLVRAGRWDDVFRQTTEPPTRDAASFAELMANQVAKHGTIRSVRIDGLRLLRSRTVPLLEVRETLTTSNKGTTKTTRTVSYFARRGNRWLFAFSSV